MSKQQEYKTDQQKTLKIVIPVYNEKDNIENLYRNIQNSIQFPKKIFVIYDFDEDNTVPVVQKLAKRDKSLLLIKNTFGRGFLGAIKTGFKQADDGPVLVLMADLSDDLGDVARMMELYEQGNVIVCGSRYMKGGRQIGSTFVKRSLARAAGVSLHYFRRIPTHDITNNFKLYDGSFLRNTEIESKKGACASMEVTVKAFLQGKPIAEVPTTWRDRTEGEASFKLWEWLPHYMAWYLYAFRPRQNRATRR